MNKEYPSLYLGDCLDIMRTFPDNVVDSIITDPPYGIEFLGKEWDRGVPGAPFWEEMLRIAKPGAILLAMGGTRTYHRLVCAIEDAGWEIRDTIAWVYGCLSEDTEILTINGWKRYHRDIDRSSVLCYNIDSGTFEFYVPSRSFIYENKHTAYHIQSDYTDQIVSRNHRCIVERDGRKVFAYAETLEQQESVPILESLRDLPDAIYDHESYSSIEKEVLLALCNTSAKEEKTTNRAQVNVSHLLNLRQRILQAILLCKENCEKLLLLPVQRRSTGTGLEAARSQGKGVLDCRIGTKFYRADDGRHESRVERRSNLFQKAWELCSDKVCSLSERISGYVSQRRLCYGASVDCGSISGALSCENRSRSSYQSRPDGQQAGKSDAIQEQPRTQTVRRTRATVTPIEYEGNVWCVEVPTGAFVARRNGKIFITGNSGFPKSYDISKGIDKKAGAEREVVGWNENLTGRTRPEDNPVRFTDKANGTLTAPSTPEAQLWHGWGTALKPAMELICVAMKPIDGTYVNNALTWGVAGLWIDGSRVETDEETRRTKGGWQDKGYVGGKAGSHNDFDARPPQGRFPANVIHDGSDEVTGLFPMTKSGAMNGVYQNTIMANKAGTRDGKPVHLRQEASEGSAARFFMSCKQDDLCELCFTPKHSIMSDIDNSEVIRCKNISANNVEKNLTTTQAVSENIAQLSVPDWLIEKAVHFAKSVGNLCDSCATSIVREVAEVKTWDSKRVASQVIQDFIGNSNECILIQNLAHYAGLMESIDTTPTTTSLSKLFGCASRVITNYIQETEKTAPKRFLYTAKASRSERNAGLEGMEEREWHGQMPKNDPNYVRSDGAVRTQNLPRQNHHPTVKPLALMRYLVRLTKTPTGGVVLDPFMGSGTTGIAAVMEGRDFIGIELNAEYLEIAERRIAEAQKQPRLEGV